MAINLITSAFLGILMPADILDFESLQLFSLVMNWMCCPFLKKKIFTLTNLLECYIGAPVDFAKDMYLDLQNKYSDN